jgi:hypothetical protein
MKSNIGLIPILLAGLMAALPAQSQLNSDQNTTPGRKSAPAREKGRSAGGDIGSGSGDIGQGAARGAGNLAAGAGKGAADLVTLHPINAAMAVGKGGAAAGKNIGVGTVKGTGKIAKGIGKGIKHIF